MKRFLILCWLFVGTALSGAEIHVSPRGLDTNDGSAEAPFESLLKARESARTLRGRKPNEPVTIYLHGGIYYLPDSITWTKEDSGNADAPLTIAAWQREKPVLVGGKRIENWSACRNESFPKGTFQADLSDYGITKRFKILYSRGKTATWARYPDFQKDYPYSGGWAYVDGKPFDMYRDIEGEPLDVLALREQDRKNWSRPEDGFISIFPRHNWWNNVRQIKEIDRKTGMVTLAADLSYGARPADRFCVMGMREELDVPGEWYQDVVNHKLYFLPPNGDDLKDVVVPTAENVLALRQASHVILRGLTLYGANRNGIDLNDCSDCSVEGCTVHDVSFDNGSGISVQGGTRCRIVGCDVFNTGAHGISVRGGDMYTLTECGHVVENNYVHHTGNIFKHGNGISAGGCGVRVAHNLIHDMPRYGIMFGGANIVVEYNHVRHVNLEMEDSGVIYTNGSHWMNSRGSTIRYNRFQDSIGFGHHLGKYKFRMFTWGIYLDDNTGGVDVIGNIVERCTVGGLHLHNSRDNHLFNNIFIDGGAQQYRLSGWTDDPNARFMKRHRNDMIKAYERAMKHPGWHDKRGMQTHPKDAVLPDGTIMANNRIERNIFYYVNQPQSLYVRATRCNFQVNRIDHNIVWNGGGEPIRTEYSGVGEVKNVLTETIPSIDFRNVGKDGLPEGWKWYLKTRPDAKIEIVDGLEGAKALRLHAAFNPEAKYIKHANVYSPRFKLEPGKSYRLRMRISLGGDATPADRALVRLVAEQGGYWKAFGNQSFRPKERESEIVETTFGIPAEGDPEFDERNASVTLHFQHVGEAGWSQFEQIVFEEVVLLDPWKAWQRQGCDIHSIVADPMFVDPEKGNFRLRPDSPALKLGFEPIPQDKIGLYESPERAVWPIVEAKGIREHPEWLRIPPAATAPIE